MDAKPANRGERAQLSGGSLLFSLALMVVAGLAMAGVSAAMRSNVARGAQSLPEAAVTSAATPIASLPAVPRAAQPTDLVVLVASEAQAERLRSRSNAGVIGSRGRFDLSVVVVQTPEAERLLRQMVLGNALMCPAGSCADVAILDLRSLD